MGDPNARLDALLPQGSVAHDVAQCFRLENIADACLGTSDLVAEVTFPRQLDLLDVLLVCRAIHEGEKTCNYTLEIFNCYFFALAIQSALTRLVANWGVLISQDDWSSSITKAINALSKIYRTPASTEEKESLWLRIYSLSNTHLEGPARQLLEKIKKICDNPLLLQEMNQTLGSVLWHSSLSLAVDSVLESHVRDSLAQILDCRSPNTSGDDPRTPKSPLSPSTTGIPSSRGTVPTEANEPADANVKRLKSVLKALALIAVSKHKALSPRPNQKRRQNFTGVFQFIPSPKQLPHLDFRKAATEGQQTQHAQGPSVAVANSNNRQRALIEWIGARALVIWAICAALFFLRSMWLDLGRLPQYELVDERLRHSLIQLESEGRGSTGDLVLVLQEIRAFCEAESGVMWNEFPWTHVHDLIKEYVLHLLALKETKCLKVAIQVSHILNPI